MIKKVILALGVLLLIFTVAFFALGFLFPTFEIETHTIVDKPRNVVWAYFVDETKTKEWMTNLKSMETISGAPLSIGSKFRMTFSENGSEIVMTETMTEFKEQEIFAFNLQNDVISANDRLLFLDHGNTTEIVETDQITGGNPFWRSLFILMKSNFQKKSAEIYARLKLNVERE